MLRTIFFCIFVFTSAAAGQDPKPKPKQEPKEVNVAPDPKKVTRANFEKIKIGMTLFEAEQILGGGKITSASGNDSQMTWRGEAGIVVQMKLEFDPPGPVMDRDRQVHTFVRAKRIID